MLYRHFRMVLFFFFGIDEREKQKDKQDALFVGVNEKLKCTMRPIHSLSIIYLSFSFGGTSKS